MPHDRHGLDHQLVAVLGLVAHGPRLGLPFRAGAAAGAGDHARAPARQHIERGPLIGQHHGVPERERAHAGGAQQHPLGAARNGGEQGQRIEPAIDESASPHHTESMCGEASTASASSSSALGVVKPTRTPRLERVMPKFISGPWWHGQPDELYLFLNSCRPLFHEGRHAFLLILGGKQGMKDPPLNADAFRKRSLEGAIDRFLRRQHRRQRHRRNRFSKLHRLIHQGSSRNHTRHQPGTLGLGGIHHAPGQNHIHGLRLADRARQPLRAADARNDRKLDLRLAELGGVGRDHDIALHHQLAAAAERETRNRGYHWLAGIGGSVPGAGEIAHDHVDGGLVDHLLDVGAGRESFLRTGDHDAADPRIGVERRNRLRQLVIERPVKRIERLRPVEPDDAHPALGFDHNIAKAHRVSPVLLPPV